MEKESQLVQLNLSVVALVALVAIVGMVTLVANKPVGLDSTAGVAANDDSVVGEARASGIGCVEGGPCSAGCSPGFCGDGIYAFVPSRNIF